MDIIFYTKSNNRNISLLPTCISDFATEDVWVTVLVQWSENLVRTSPRSWNFPVLCAEFPGFDMREDLLVNVVVFKSEPALEDVDCCKESWFLIGVLPDIPFEVLSTTSINSANCLVRKGVLSPCKWKYGKLIIFNQSLRHTLQYKVF